MSGKTLYHSHHVKPNTHLRTSSFGTLVHIGYVGWNHGCITRNRYMEANYTDDSLQLHLPVPLTHKWAKNRICLQICSFGVVDVSVGPWQRVWLRLKNPSNFSPANNKTHLCTNTPLIIMLDQIPNLYNSINSTVRETQNPKCISVICSNID